MQTSEPSENPFTLDPTLKSLLTFKEQEKHIIPKEQYFENPHDRLYYTFKGSAQYGLIKKLEDQALGLSEARNQFFTTEKKTSSLNSTPNKEVKIEMRTSGSGKRLELPAINQSKKYNIKQFVKERPETLGEFLGKGKEMFLAKMMEGMKKEETMRLNEFIINEEETLNEHEADFKEHVKFSNTFIQELNKDAEATFNESKKRLKEINDEHNKIAHLEQQIRTLESQIKKREEEKEISEAYKKFFDELYENVKKNQLMIMAASNNVASRDKDKEKNKFFLTEKEPAAEEEEDGNKEVVQEMTKEEQERKLSKTKFDNPKQIADILKRIDDATMFLIHNTQEKEEDLEKTRRDFENQRQQIDQKFQNRKDSLAHTNKIYEKLEKEKIQAQEKLNKLRQMDKAPQKGASDNGEINKSEIFQKIYTICVGLIGDKATKDITQSVTNSEDALKLLTRIEKEFETVIAFYNEKMYDHNLKTLMDIEKLINKEKRIEQTSNKAESDRQRNLLALEKQKLKKVVKKKGRRPMHKMLLETEKQVEEVVDDDDSNDDERYFKDNFVFMDGGKSKPDTQEVNNERAK